MASPISRSRIGCTRRTNDDALDDHPRRARRVVPGTACPSWPTTSVAATTNTAQILAKTTAALPRCLRWRLTGICLWLRCGIRGCRVRVSPRVFNYAPDAVVTTHNEPALHPWVEARPILAAANAGLAGRVGGFADASGSVEGRRNRATRIAAAITRPSARPT